jgi:hypothetical protein
MDLKMLCATPSWEWPDDAADTLLEVLRDTNASADDRLLAAELASDVTAMNDEIAEALLALLRSPGETNELRGQAAISLGPTLEMVEMEMGWDDDDLPVSEATAAAIPEALHRAYLDAGTPKFVRRRALEAAVRAPADWHAGAIRAAYHSGDSEWMLTAVFGMAHAGGFEAEILEALESNDPALRYEAVLAAGNWGLKKAWGHVSRIVEHGRGDKMLLLAAIEAAVGIRPAEAASLLVDLIDHPDDDIAAAAGEALALSSDPWEEDDEDEP